MIDIRNIILTLISILTVTSSNSQDAKELIEKESDRLGELIIILRLKLDSINYEIDSLKEINTGNAGIIENCNKELYTLVGMTEQEVADYRYRFESFDKNSSGKLLGREELRNEFLYISKSKARCLPEFNQRYIAFTESEMIASLFAEESKDTVAAKTVTSTISYIVAAGDHLWKISELFFNDPYLWTKIYNANRQYIIDPDLIYPGQILSIPAK